MQALAINGTWGVSSSIAITGTGPDPGRRAPPRCRATSAFTPVRALYFTAGILAIVRRADQGPRRSSTSAAGFSPFTGGQLLIRFGYDENVDTLSRIRNRFFGPSVRWNIRTGTYLDVAYTWNDSFQPALLTQSRNLFATLFVTFL